MGRDPNLSHLSNPPNPWRLGAVEWLEEPPEVDLQVFEDRSRSILSKNNSPDLFFEWSVNPYRGCYHGCAYCYARPTHEYLDFGAGTDFERKLVVKPDAAQLLERSFERPRWRGQLVIFSGNTDCYQPLEAAYGLTRACLEVCLRYRNPVGIVTKSVLIERDVELLAELAERAHCTVSLSIPFWDPDSCKAVEPYTSSPRRRMRALARLAEAGVPVGVNICPVIPGLNDRDIPMILEAAKDAGAWSAALTMVRLPGPVREVFVERIRSALPLAADRILHQIEACRGGMQSDSRFGERMRGQGARWQAIERLFQTTAKRLGLATKLPDPPSPSPFRRPRAQLDMFGEEQPQT